MDLLPPYTENEDAPTNEAKIAVLMGAVKDVIKIEALNTKRTSSKSQKNSRENSKDRNQMGSARGSHRGSLAPPSTNTSSSIYSLPQRKLLQSVDSCTKEIFNHMLNAKVNKIEKMGRTTPNLLDKEKNKFQVMAGDAFIERFKNNFERTIGSKSGSPQKEPREDSGVRDRFMGNKSMTIGNLIPKGRSSSRNKAEKKGLDMDKARAFGSNKNISMMAEHQKLMRKNLSPKSLLQEENH
jgi:hypothetical protein